MDITVRGRIPGTPAPHRRTVSAPGPSGFLPHPRAPWHAPRFRVLPATAQRPP